jgi:Helix-hairpin-helix motif
VNRVVGAVVVIGMICLGGILGEWMVRVQLTSADSLAAVIPPDSFAVQTVLISPSPARAPRPAPQPPANFQNDPLSFLSRAPLDSLDLLPGIGPVLAGRIVEARRARGGFSSWSDVLAVKGIGPRMVARWRTLSERQ